MNEATSNRKIGGAIGKIEMTKVEAGAAAGVDFGGYVSGAKKGHKLGGSRNLEISQLGGFNAGTDFGACLVPLLDALNWNGDMRIVAEAMPHFTEDLDLTGFRNVMANLRYRSRGVESRLNHIDRRLFPCLFVPYQHDAMVILRERDDQLYVFDGETNDYVWLPAKTSWNGTAYLFSEVKVDELKAGAANGGWFKSTAARFRPLLVQILALTLVINLLALAVPLFIKSVYDVVVATGSLQTLAYLSMGVVIALVCDLLLRVVRSRVMSYIGARLDNIIGNSIFERILFLPPIFTERATIGAQVARIKDFENLREFFTGPMALVLLEIPFVLIFLTVIAVMGGPIAFVPLAMIFAFAVVGFIFGPLIKESVAQSAKAVSKRQEFTIEALSNLRAVRYTGAENRWTERYREVSAAAAYHTFRTSQLSAMVQNISHVLMVSAGIATIAFGVVRVINGDMTAGGLVASMILVWRVLSPLQTGFIIISRLEQIRNSIKQLDTLMNLRAERDISSQVVPVPRLEGRVIFSRVSMRYRPDSDPAIMGITFAVEPGEVLAIVGGNGCGKSTVIKLINGMYTPQGGNVRIDDMDIRQIDPIELRYSIAYLPQTPDFFYGTVAQNLRLANPTATDAELVEAAKKANAYDDIMKIESGDGAWLRHGFEARIGDAQAAQLPTSLQQRLSLTRAYLKKSSILLLDEPSNGLDFIDDKMFMDVVRNLKGKTTVFIVTHRPSHLKLADKILWLENGHSRLFGPAKQVMERIPKEFV